MLVEAECRADGLWRDLKICDSGVCLVPEIMLHRTDTCRRRSGSLFDKRDGPLRSGGGFGFTG